MHAVTFVNIYALLSMCRKLVSYKSARNYPTNCTCGLFYELCRECVGKFPTKVPGFSRQY